MSLINVGEKNFEKEVLKSKQKVIVDFNATWCGPCQMLKPIIEVLSEETKDVKFVSINIDEEEALCHDYNVQAVPCLIMFENGKETKRTVGFVSVENLVNWIDN